MTRSASILAVTRSAARAKRQMVASSFSSLSSTSVSFGQSACVNTSVPDAPLSIAMPDNCSQTPDVAAMRKISALEDELSKLREQIAMIVINQEHAGKEYYSTWNYIKTHLGSHDARVDKLYSM